MEEMNIIQKIVVMAPPLVFAIVLHELAHGWVALKLGDHTAKDMGRLTLNPISHIDLYGTIIMPIFLYVLTHGSMLFGYAKPVPINPYNFKDPNKGMALSSLAGPGINMVMAICFSFLLRIVFPPIEEMIPKQAWDMIVFPFTLMLGYGIVFNVVLAILNMIPIPPLDGSRVVYWMLPPRPAAAYYGLQPHIMKGFTYLFFLHILLSIINAEVYSPLRYVFTLLGLIINPVIRPILAFLLGGNIL